MSRLSVTSRSTFFFFSVEIYLRRYIYRDRQDKSRLSRFLRFVKTFWDLSRLFEIYRDISTLSRLFEVLQDQKSRQIEKSQSRNVIKLTNSRSRSRQTVEICQKCHVSTDFSISIETFETGRWCRDKIETKILKVSRSTFFHCRDRESRSRPRRDKSRPPTLYISLSTYKYVNAKLTLFRSWTFFKWK